MMRLKLTLAAGSKSVDQVSSRARLENLPDFEGPSRRSVGTTNLSNFH